MPLNRNKASIIGAFYRFCLAAFSGWPLWPIIMRQTLLISIFFSFSVCIFGQTRKDITGFYGECTPGFFACTQIELKKDSTFEYGIFYDVGGWVSWTGKWTMKRDTLVLNSFRQPKDSLDYAMIKMSYCFYQSGFIVDLKHIVKRNKIYTWDFKNKCISKKIFLKKTNIKNKEFSTDNKY